MIVPGFLAYCLFPVKKSPRSEIKRIGNNYYLYGRAES